MYGYDQQRQAVSAAQAGSYNFDATVQREVMNYAFNQGAISATAAAGYGQSMNSYGSGAYSKGYNIGVPSNSNNVPIGASANLSANYGGYPAPRTAAYGVMNQNRRLVGKVAWPKKKVKVPKPPVDISQFYCEICSITCGGPQAWQDHLVGKNHKRKEAAKANPALAHKGEYRCEVCNVSCTGKDSYETHMIGSKHNRAVSTLKKLGKPIPENSVPQGDPMQNLPVTKKVVGVSSTKFVGGVNLTTTEKDEDQMDGDLDAAEEDTPPVGEEFLEEVKGGKQVQYRCKLCDCTCGDPAAKALHVKGRRHRLQYKVKVDSTIQVDIKPNSRIKGVKGAVQMAASRANGGFKPVPHAFPMGGSMAAAPDTTVYDAYDEQHVHARLEQIRPDFERVKAVESLVELVEKTLKTISDKFAEESDNDAERLLKGVIRVGPLGEHLLLQTDSEVNAVLLCREAPTATLLQDIVTRFQSQVEAEKVNSVKVEPHLESSSLEVAVEGNPVKCVVTLTSVVLRAQDSADTKEAPKEAPADVLPAEPCLKALADLRHTKYFQSKCMEVQSLVEVVLLLRDVAFRVETWNVLSLYVIELLVYKSINSHPVPMRVCDAFRRFFEVMSTGQFLSPRSFLEDPCEKEPTNPLHALSKQQRENIICSAQHGLRLIAFDQIEMILGMNRVSPSRKRPTDSDGDDEGNEPKKEKLDEPASEPQTEAGSAP